LFASNATDSGTEGKKSALAVLMGILVYLQAYVAPFTALTQSLPH